MSTEYVKSISVLGVVLPNHPLSNYDLTEAVKKLDIPFFRGIFMRDCLPNRPLKNECGILNLDDSGGKGTHWTCWFKTGNKKISFDSYGLPPAEELVKYLRCPVYYNSEQIQPHNEVFCGHLCLFVLKKLSEGDNFQKIINKLF